MDDGSEALFDAIDDGDVAALRALLARDRSLAHRRDEGGLTPLMRVLMGLDRDPQLVEALLGAGADPNATTEDGEAALHLVVDVEGDGGFGEEPLQLVRALVERGAELETTQAEGLTPLQFAVVHGTPDEVGALAACGASVDALLPGSFDPPALAGLTPLAAALGSPEKVAALLGAGADRGRPSTDGKTAAERCAVLIGEAEGRGDEDFLRALRSCADLLSADSSGH